jgi:hypothetical protein
MHTFIPITKDAFSLTGEANNKITLVEDGANPS